MSKNRSKLQLVKPANEIHARCAARILRFTSKNNASADDCKCITNFASRLLYGDSVDYSMLLAAQEELVKLGGSAEMLDEVRSDFLH